MITKIKSCSIDNIYLKNPISKRKPLKLEATYENTCTLNDNPEFEWRIFEIISENETKEIEIPDRSTSNILLLEPFVFKVNLDHVVNIKVNGVDAEGVF